jgi:hypothetical protein
MHRTMLMPNLGVYSPVNRLHSPLIGAGDGFQSCARVWVALARRSNGATTRAVRGEDGVLRPLPVLELKLVVQNLRADIVRLPLSQTIIAMDRHAMGCAGGAGAAVGVGFHNCPVIQSERAWDSAESQHCASSTTVQAPVDDRFEPCVLKSTDVAAAMGAGAGAGRGDSGANRVVKGGNSGAQVVSAPSDRPSVDLRTHEWAVVTIFTCLPAGCDLEADFLAQVPLRTLRLITIPTTIPTTILTTSLAFYLHLHYPY